MEFQAYISYYPTNKTLEDSFQILMFGSCMSLYIFLGGSKQEHSWHTLPRLKTAFSDAMCSSETMSDSAKWAD